MFAYIIKQDVAMKSLTELWFCPFKNFVKGDGADFSDPTEQLETREQSFANQSTLCKTDIKIRAFLLVDVTSAMSGGTNTLNAADPFGDFLKQLMNNCVKTAKRDISNIALSIIECLSEQLLALEECGDKASGFT